ncbi:hypothetical protein [Cellulomonas sp. ICMP 17802]
MPRTFKSALVALAFIGTLTLSSGAAIADGTSDSPTTGGASGCCRLVE